jgi:hypothetical protein
VSVRSHQSCLLHTLTPRNGVSVRIASTSARLHDLAIVLTGHGVPPATETMFLPLSTKRGESLRPLRDLSMRATNTQHPVLPAKSCHIVGELAVPWGGWKGTSRTKWPGSSVTPGAIPASALKHFSNQRKLASGRVRREAKSFRDKLSRGGIT